MPSGRAFQSSTAWQTNRCWPHEPHECGVLCSCRCCLCCWFWIGVLMLVGGRLGVLLEFVVGEKALFGWDCKISIQSCTRSSSKLSSTSEFSTSTILDRSNVFCSARTFRCCCLSSLFLSFSFCFSLLAGEALGRFSHLMLFSHFLLLLELYSLKTKVTVSLFYAGSGMKKGEDALFTHHCFWPSTQPRLSHTCTCSGTIDN